MNRISRWTLLACLLLAGCPGKDAAPDGKTPEPGLYADYSQLMGRQADFEAELKRLQGLSGGEANPASVSTGSAQLQYKLGQRVREDSIAVVIRDIVTNEEIVLTVWQDLEHDQDPPQPTNQQETTGGMVLEYVLDSDIFMSLSLRWVQDRYLEVKRTFEAGGLDMEFELGDGYTSWALEVAPLPYRLSPGIEGPFGLVSEEQADGGWNGAAYPRDMLLPAVAAYDQSGGVLLAISDDHPRELDREYGVWWRLPGRQHDPDDNTQLKIDYGIYNSTVDRITDPVLISGLPQRDSVVIEPFSLRATTMEDSFVAGTTEQVADRMSDFVRAFHARYTPRMDEAPYTIMSLAEDMPGEAELNELLRLKTGPWNTQALLLDGQYESLLSDASLALTEEYGIDVWVQYSPFAWSGNHPVLMKNPELRMLLPGGQDDNTVALSIRHAATADMILSNYAEEVGGRSLLLHVDPVEFQNQDQLRMPLVASQRAALALLAMKLCEENSGRDKPNQLAILGLPSIAFPPCADQYVLPAPTGDSPLQQRMLGMLVHRIFGVRPWSGYGEESAAALAISVSRHSGALVFNSSLLDYSGMDMLLQESDNLFDLSGSVANYTVLHCVPRYGSYTLVGEAPLRPDELIIGLPQLWDGKPAIFLGIFGTDVDALLDRDQQILNLQLRDGNTALHEMPFGLYEVANPDPAVIPDGDVLLIRRELISADTKDQG